VRVFSALVLAFLVSTSFLNAESDSCYSLQVSSVNNKHLREFHIKSYPKSCELVYLTQMTAVRCGCYETYKEAKNKSSDLMQEYPNSILVSSYKKRFKKYQNQNSPPALKEEALQEPTQIKTKPKLMEEDNEMLMLDEAEGFSELGDEGEEGFSDSAGIGENFDMAFDNDSLSMYEDDHIKSQEQKGLDIHGFAEYRLGTFTQNHFQDYSINEVRAQAATKYIIDDNKFFAFKGDVYHDEVLNQSDIEIREAYLFLRPHNDIDIKLGRQVVLWGTGDMVYVNDFSPKSWTSGFIGRDDEYAKLPSDALRVNGYFEEHHLDFVMNLRFRPDETPTSDRFLVYDPLTGDFIGNANGPDNVYNDGWFEDMTYALRYAYEYNGYEFNAYMYNGYWTIPSEYVLPPNNDYTYSGLNAYGASVQGNLAKGIANVEMAYYDSKDDRSGDNPLISNSLFRTLVGYEQEVSTNFSAGLQVLYDVIEKDENYRLYTLRLTRFLLQQTLKLSSFTYYSPSADDMFWKLNLDYQYNDEWTAYAGANFFAGKQNDTFFGAVQDNSNIFLGLRYNY